MDITKLREPLKDSEIELRVGNVFKYGDKFGMKLLAYKTARVDASRLDNSVGPLNWRNEYFYDKKNVLCCKVSIYCKDKKEWVSKEDVGTESFSEKEKGSYSDAFKRACFKWGIGTELYNIKNIVIYNLNPNDVRVNNSKKTYSYKKNLSQWKIERKNNSFIIYDDKGNKMSLSTCDDKFNNDIKNKTSTDPQNTPPQPQPQTIYITRQQAVDIYTDFGKTGAEMNDFITWLQSNVSKEVDKVENLTKIPLGMFDAVKRKLREVHKQFHGVKNA